MMMDVLSTMELATSDLEVVRIWEHGHDFRGGEVGGRKKVGQWTCVELPS
jgi:hypothetical protein